MDDFFKGVFLTLGGLFCFGLVFASGWHIADEITSGTFNGNYSFMNGSVGIGSSEYDSQVKLNVQGIIRAEQICDENGVNCQDLSEGGSSMSQGVAVYVKDKGLSGYPRCYPNYNCNYNNCGNGGFTTSPTCSCPISWSDSSGCTGTIQFENTYIGHLGN